MERGLFMNIYSDVVGFNYHPSYAYNSYEEWRFFDSDVIDREIGLGKEYFPKMNTIRLWLSYEAFRYEEDRQAKNFETALSICDKHGCMVVVCLFNCWHDSVMDNGGIYHPMMIPGSIWCAEANMYDSFFRKMVAPHKDDDRILIWDICNEPYSFGGNAEYQAFIEPYETAWLKKMCDMCHGCGVTQPIGIGHYAQGMSMKLHEKTADFVDVFLVHPYYFYSDKDVETLTDEGFDTLLGKYLELSAKYNKPVLSTETCWGSRKDSVRVEIIERTLRAHKKAEIGYIAHALYWSHFADLHDDDEGPLNFPGNLMFITRDGRIRPGHEIFNKF